MAGAGRTHVVGCSAQAFLDADRAKGHRAAQGFNLRDAVSPVAARRAAHQVSRARRGEDRGAVPSVGDLAAQAKRTGRQERDAGDGHGQRSVSMPADAGAGREFGDQGVAEASGGQSRERRHPIQQRNEEIRNAFAVSTMAPSTPRLQPNAATRRLPR